MNLYMEFVGGLGDVILRMYFSGRLWYEALETMPEGERAKIVLMCHNPYLAEIFKWHPKKKQIDLFDFGFTTPFHPWENKEWRQARDLPDEAVCPPYSPSETMKFYPSPSDKELLKELRGERFIVLSATASTDDKSIPRQMGAELTKIALDKGFKVLVVGRRKYFHDGRVNDVEIVPGVIDAVDNLTVPGTIEAIKLSKGVITAHSAALHMAWSENIPVFLIYNEFIKKVVVPCGPVGYMQGMNRKDTDHMEFSEYQKERAYKWLEKLPR